MSERNLRALPAILFSAITFLLCPPLLHAETATVRFGTAPGAPAAGKVKKRVSPPPPAYIPAAKSAPEIDGQGNFF